MMRTRLITSTIDRSTPGQSLFINDIRKGISMSEQLRKERARLFNGVKQKEEARRSDDTARTTQTTTTNDK